MIVVNGRNFVPQEFPNGERKFYIGSDTIPAIYGLEKYYNANIE